MKVYDKEKIHIEQSHPTGYTFLRGFIFNKANKAYEIILSPVSGHRI